MLSKNWYNNEVVVSNALTPQVLTADANGVEIDTIGYDSIVFVAHVGVSGDTLSGSVLVDMEIQDTATSGSGETAVADNQLENPNTGGAGAVTGTNTGTFARVDDPAEDDAYYAVRVVNAERYVRCVANLTGTHTNGIPIGVTAILSRGQYV